MARIRSIKPEFFTSETLARVSLSARLTFIGLWTYVDDNGVGIDNARLIGAALYPLDEDPLESLRRVQEDLRQLSDVGVIARYEISGRRYLHVTNWDEHQKVSHPGKPRYPLPPKDAPKPPTSRNSHSPETLPNASGDSPEGLARSSALSREQGAGSREQGSAAPAPGQTAQLSIVPDLAADEPQQHDEQPDDETEGQRINRLARVYADLVPLCAFLAVQGVVRKAVRATDDEHRPLYADAQIADGLRLLAKEKRALTAASLRIAIEGQPTPSSGYQPYQNPTDQDVYDSYRAWM